MHISHIKVILMANITLSIPEALYARMREYSEYKWSEVARKAIEQKVDEAEFMADLKAFERAEKELKAGKTIPLRAMAKKLGIKL